MRLYVFLFLGTLLYLGIIVTLLIRRRVNVSNVLLWLMSAFLMIVLTIFPQLATVISQWLGFELPINFIFTVEGLCVLLILLYLTTKASNLTNRVYNLTQLVAIMEKRLSELEAQNADRD